MALNPLLYILEKSHVYPKNLKNKQPATTIATPMPPSIRYWSAGVCRSYQLFIFFGIPILPNIQKKGGRQASKILHPHALCAFIHAVSDVRHPARAALCPATAAHRLGGLFLFPPLPERGNVTAPPAFDVVYLYLRFDHFFTPYAASRRVVSTWAVNVPTPCRVIV